MVITVDNAVALSNLLATKRTRTIPQQADYDCRPIKYSIEEKTSWLPLVRGPISVLYGDRHSYEIPSISHERATWIPLTVARIDSRLTTLSSLELRIQTCVDVTRL